MLERGTGIPPRGEQKERKTSDIYLAHESLPKGDNRWELLHRADQIVQDIHDKQFDLLVFLDKSARPLRTIIKELWSNAYPGEAFPTTRFINIGTPERGMGASEHLPIPNNTQGVFRELRHLATNSWISKESLEASIAKEEREDDDTSREEYRQILAHFNESDLHEKISIPKSFDQGFSHVGVIDDFIHNGISMSHAIGLLSARNQHATVEGVAFFPSSWYKDAQLMPWRGRVEDMGVMDRPSSPDRAFAYPGPKGTGHLRGAFREALKEMVSVYVQEKPFLDKLVVTGFKEISCFDQESHRGTVSLEFGGDLEQGFIVTRGENYFIMDGNSFSGSPGDEFLIPKGKRARIKLDPNGFRFFTGKRAESK